jgi:hypothetical protein
MMRVETSVHRRGALRRGARLVLIHVQSPEEKTIQDPDFTLQSLHIYYKIHGIKTPQTRKAL